MADAPKTQRRNFVRLNVRVPLEYTIVSDDIGLPETYSATTKDLSGGGLRFDSKVELAINTELEMILDIPRQGKITAVGQVVRCIPLEFSPKYSIGVEFTLIDKKDRERLIRFIFERQRELRQKGLI